MALLTTRWFARCCRRNTHNFAKGQPVLTLCNVLPVLCVPWTVSKSAPTGVGLVKCYRCTTEVSRFGHRCDSCLLLQLFTYHNFEGARHKFTTRWSRDVTGVTHTISRRANRFEAMQCCCLSCVCLKHLAHMSPGGVGLVACYRGITMVSHMVTGVTLDIYFFVPPFREDMELFTTHRIAGCYRCHMHNFAKGQPMSTPCNFAAYQARVTNHLARVYPTGAASCTPITFIYLFFLANSTALRNFERARHCSPRAEPRSVTGVAHYARDELTCGDHMPLIRTRY